MAGSHADAVPALSPWDDSPTAPWSQLQRRLRDAPEVWVTLRDALREHPATKGHLTAIAPYYPERPSDSAWFTSTWQPGGAEVLVKVNVTRREHFWMTAASRSAPGVVPHVFAGGMQLGDVDAAWLVLKRIPYQHEPAWGPPAFSALLGAAARFQVFASSVETDLAYDEDAATIRHWALAGRGIGEHAGRVVRNIENDWVWAEAVAGREVMFGDLHFGNAAFRSRPPWLSAVLFDPIPRRQPWPFEPAYLEVLCGGAGLVREMAAIRTAQGRPVPGEEEVDRLSALFCGWMALLFWGTVPDRRADPLWRARLTRYVAAAARLDR
jgi:hypothetical protein